MRSRVAALVALLALGLTLPAGADQTIRWNVTLNGAVQAAARSNQLILIHFWASYCGACRKMETDVFGDPAVAELVNTQFVPLKLNTEHFPATANQFGITTLPTDLVVTPQGQVLQRMGPCGAAEYVARLNQVLVAYRNSPGAAPVQAQVPGPGAYANQAAQAPGQAPQGYAANAVPNAMGQYPAGATMGGAPGQGQAQPGSSMRVATYPNGVPGAQPPTIGQQGPGNIMGPQVSAIAQPPAGNAMPNGLTSGSGFGGPTPPVSYSAAAASAGAGILAPGSATPPANGSVPTALPPAGGSLPCFAPVAGQMTQGGTGPLPATSGYAGPTTPPSAMAPQVAGMGAGLPVSGTESFTTQNRAPAAGGPPSAALGTPWPPSANASLATSGGAAAPNAPSRSAAGGSSSSGSADIVPPGNPPLGLDGFCPVTLYDAQKWEPGDRRWGVIHRNRTYLFHGPEEQKRFLANPDAFAPVAEGVDVVLLLEQGVPVPGQRQHGVFFENKVYLFSNEQTLQRFTSNPDYYSRAALQAFRPTSYSMYR